MLHYEITTEMQQRASQGWVGIWKPREDAKGTRSWVRAQEYFAEWGLWATNHVIPAKGSKRRVVLIGESVARGFLYDHYFTPAQALRGFLDAEVIDLARTGMSREHLEWMVQSAATLQPDLIVVFSGNNWVEDGSPMDDAEHRAAAQALRSGGVLGLKEHLAATLRERVRRSVVHIHELAASQRTPVLWIVPSANRHHWRFAEPTAPLLPDTDSAAWCRLQASAQHLLEEQRYDEALEAARAMAALDRGVSASPATLAAACLRALGREAEAATWSRVAADAQAWDLAPQNPRTVSAVREVLIEEATRAGAMIVDTETLVDPAVDYLDYCHLTADAIGKVCWRAAELASARLQIATTRPGRAEGDLGVTPELEARARLLAAIHAAHYGQPASLVRAFLREALERWPAIAPVMKSFLGLQTKQAPAWMCSELAELCHGSQLNVGRYLGSYAATDFVKLFDAVLIEEIRNTLAAHHHGDVDTDSMRLREDGVKPGVRTNLLDPRYAPSYSHADWWHWTAIDTRHDAQRHYFAAHLPSSTFTFVAGSAQALVFEAVVRLPHGAAPGRCRVAVNGREHSVFELGSAWQPIRIAIPADSLRNGINELQFTWPEFSGDTRAALERAVHDLANGHHPQLLCERGHLHSLTATGGV